MVKSRILLVAPYTHPYKAGGGINAFNFARYLNRTGTKATLLSFNRNLRHRTFEKKEGVRIIRIPYFNRGMLLKILSLILMLPVYASMLMGQRFVIIYGGYILGWEVLVLLGRITGTRIYFRSTMFGEDDARSTIQYRKILSGIRRAALKNINCYFSLTPAFSASYLSSGGSVEKLIETSQGVDYELIKQLSPSRSRAREQLNIPDSIFVIISTGIVVQRKGYPKIFEQLIHLSFPFLYIVLGEYHLLPTHHMHPRHGEVTRIYQDGKNLLGKRIRFEGFVDNVLPYLAAADAFISGSSREGLPNALLEAMAMSLPPVVLRINQLEPYLLQHGYNALLYDQYTELPEHLEYLYHHPDECRKLGENGEKTIAATHTFEHVTQRLGIR